MRQYFHFQDIQHKEPLNKNQHYILNYLKESQVKNINSVVFLTGKRKMLIFL